MIFREEQIRLLDWAREKERRRVALQRGKQAHKKEMENKWHTQTLQSLHLHLNKLNEEKKRSHLLLANSSNASLEKFRQMQALEELQPVKDYYDSMPEERSKSVFKKKA